VVVVGPVVLQSARGGTGVCEAQLCTPRKARGQRVSDLASRLPLRPPVDLVPRPGVRYSLVMAGAAHAFLILALAGAPVALAVRFWERPRRSRAALAVLAAVGVLLAGSLFVHACGAGLPWRQVLVTSIGVGVSMACIGRAWVRRVASALLVAVGVGAAAHWTGLVHSDRYTGNAAWVEPSMPGATATKAWHTPLSGLWRVEVSKAERARQTAPVVRE